MLSQKIPVKVCSYTAYTTFIEQHCEDGLLGTSISFAEDLIDFLNELPAYEVMGTTSIIALASRIWQEEQLNDQSRTSLTFTQSDDEQCERSFFCYQYGTEALPIGTKLEELYHDSNHVLVLVYRENRQQVITTGSALRTAAYYARWGKRHEKKRTYSDFVCESLPDASRGFKAVLIDKSENERVLNKSFRGLYKRYIKASKKYTEGLLEISFLEMRNSGLNKEHLDYWAAKLNPDSMLASQFVGDTSTMPYSLKELKQIVPRSIPLGKLPFWLFYRNLNEGHMILTMPEGKGSVVFLEALIRTFLSVHGSIKSEANELKKAIKTRLQENVVPSTPPPSPYQSKPGSKARYQEALARAREQKEKEINSADLPDEPALPKGKIRQEDLPAHVDFLFQFEGSRIMSFDHFKEKFLARYPHFLDRRGPRLL